MLMEGADALSATSQSHLHPNDAAHPSADDRAAPPLPHDEDEDGEEEPDFDDDEMDAPHYNRAVAASDFEHRVASIIRELRATPSSKLSGRLEALAAGDDLLDDDELAAEAGLAAVPYGDDFCMQLVDLRMCAGKGKLGGFYYSAMVVVGNLQGMTGYAIGKSKESNVAVAKGARAAIQNAVYVPLYRQHTIFNKIEHRFKKTKLVIMPRFRGFGLVAHPMLTELCEVIGIRDIAIKVHGSRNLRNVIKCFFEAITASPDMYSQALTQRKYIRELCTSHVVHTPRSSPATPTIDSS